MKVKRINFGIWDFFGYILEISKTFLTYQKFQGLFWHILEILGTNLNLYKIAPRQMTHGTNMPHGTNMTRQRPCGTKCNTSAKQ